MHETDQRRTDGAKNGKKTPVNNTESEESEEEKPKRRKKKEEKLLNNICFKKVVALNVERQC